MALDSLSGIYYILHMKNDTLLISAYDTSGQRVFLRKTGWRIRTKPPATPLIYGNQIYIFTVNDTAVGYFRTDLQGNAIDPTLQSFRTLQPSETLTNLRVARTGNWILVAYSGNSVPAVRASLFNPVTQTYGNHDLLTHGSADLTVSPSLDRFIICSTAEKGSYTVSRCTRLDTTQTLLDPPEGFWLPFDSTRHYDLGIAFHPQWRENLAVAMVQIPNSYYYKLQGIRLDSTGTPLTPPMILKDSLNLSWRLPSRGELEIVIPGPDSLFTVQIHPEERYKSRFLYVHPVSGTVREFNPTASHPEATSMILESPDRLSRLDADLWGYQRLTFARYDTSDLLTPLIRTDVASDSTWQRLTYAHMGWAPDGVDRMLVAWKTPQSAGRAILKAQIFTSEGAPLSGEIALDSLASRLYAPRVVFDSIGQQFVIFYPHTDGQLFGVTVSRDGGPGIPVNVGGHITLGEGSFAVAVSDSSPRYALAYQISHTPGSGEDLIYLRLLDAQLQFTGSSSWSKNTCVNPECYPVSFNVLYDAWSRTFVLVWRQTDQYHGYYTYGGDFLSLNRFDLSGSPLYGHTGKRLIDYNPNGYYIPLRFYGSTQKGRETYISYQLGLGRVLSGVDTLESLCDYQFRSYLNPGLRVKSVTYAIIGDHPLFFVTADGGTNAPESLYAVPDNGAHQPISQDVTDYRIPLTGRSYHARPLSDSTFLVQYKVLDPWSRPAFALFRLHAPSFTNLRVLPSQEVFFVGDTLTLTWNTLGPLPVVNILGSPDSLNWDTLVPDTTNQGTLQVVIPDQPTRTYTFRLRSTGLWSILKDFPPQVVARQLSWQISTDTMALGDTVFLAWSPSGIGGPVQVEVSYDNGNMWSLIHSYLPDTGGISWIVSGQPTSQARFRVVHQQYPVIQSISNPLVFRSSATLTLLSPNGGDTLFVGDSQTISWQEHGVTNVALFLSSDSGLTYLPIVPSTEAQGGSYAWVVPDHPTPYAKVRIQSLEFPSLYDESDTFFSILQPMLLAFPNGGDTLPGGSTLSVQWTTLRPDLVDTVDVYFSTDHGQNWILKGAGIPSLQGQFAFVLPNQNLDSCMVEIRHHRRSWLIHDASDQVFHIQRSTGIHEQRVTTPRAVLLPGTGEIQLYLPGSELLNLTIQDVLGRTVHKNAYRVPAGTHRISIPSLPGGIYFLRLHGTHLDTRFRWVHFQ
jgi:hypothetical protein